MVVFLEVATHEVQETLVAGSDFKRIMEQVEGFVRLRTIAVPTRQSEAVFPHDPNEYEGTSRTRFSRGKNGSG